MATPKQRNPSSGLCTALLIGLVLYFASTYFNNYYPLCRTSDTTFLSVAMKMPSFQLSPSTSRRTNLSHLVFGLVGSEKAWHYRRVYIGSWWRPNITGGYLFLDKPPAAKLLPWSSDFPPYRVSEDLKMFLNKSDVTTQRIVNAIMETFREARGDLRWLVMGDEDTIFFPDNIVDVLAQYDHTKYYYFGGVSEIIMQNCRHSFSMGYGGAGFVLSVGLAKALADDMKSCLSRYKHLLVSDQITMSCIADLGVTLTSLPGFHQIDLRGDIWGYLSAHPDFPLLSLHHFDSLSPIFPGKDRFDATRHFMQAAQVDQSRMLQQTVCYHHKTNWSFSISWGYSAQIYESILPRSYLQIPIETFEPWKGSSTGQPLYMFNTRWPSKDPCETPHVFFYESIEKTPDNETLTVFDRAWVRGLPFACSGTGNHSADSVSRIKVYSSATKRVKTNRSECCSVVQIDGDTAEVKFRECGVAEFNG